MLGEKLPLRSFKDQGRSWTHLYRFYEPHFGTILISKSIKKTHIRLLKSWWIFYWLMSSRSTLIFETSKWKFFTKQQLMSKEKLKATFKMFDKDNSGTISKELLSYLVIIDNYIIFKLKLVSCNNFSFYTTMIVISKFTDISNIEF